MLLYGRINVTLTCCRRAAHRQPSRGVRAAVVPSALSEAGPSEGGSAGMGKRDKQSVDLKQPPAFFPAKRISVTAESGSLGDRSGDASPWGLLAWGVFEDGVDAADTASSSALAHVAEFTGKDALTDILSTAEFTGKKGQSVFARLGQQGKPRVVGLVGLGKRGGSGAEQGASAQGPSVFQVLGGAVAAAAKAHKATSAAVVVDGVEGAEAAEKVTVGVQLGAYEATRFKAKPEAAPLESVSLFGFSAGGDDAAKAAIARGEALASGCLFARYLVEAPANLCTPAYLAEAAGAIAKSASDVFSLEVLEKADCEKMNMGLYLGVSECSELPPKFIHLTYKPQGEVKRRVALVGKGLTFDSGGYNLKVGGMIDMMKFDMGGAAAVLGAAQALAGIKPPDVEVHIISAACENMISGKPGALHPGDVIQGAGGKTVEVNNTDAEGRLTLADALWFAQHKCGDVKAIVDVATLTGAMMVALGNQMAGVFSPSQHMATTLLRASERAGERLWHMPMEEAYWEQMKSAIADMKNAGGRFGGAITAALFLKQYVDTEKVEWAHIDIAGPAWDEKAGGATGYGALTLAEWAIRQGQEGPASSSS